MIAASVGQLNLVKVLLSYGANISHEDADGRIAEDYADLHGYWSLSQYLAKVEGTAEAPAEDAQGDNILNILRIPERARAAGELEIKTDLENTGEAPACDTEDITIVTSPEQAGAAPSMWGAPAVDRGATDDLFEGGSVRSSDEEGNDDTWSGSEESIWSSPKVKKQQKPNLFELCNIALKYGKAGFQEDIEVLQKEKADECQWRSLCDSQEELPEEGEKQKKQEEGGNCDLQIPAAAESVKNTHCNDGFQVPKAASGAITGEHSGRTSHISLSAEKEVFKDSIENSVMQERLAQLQRQNLLLQLKLEDRKKQQLIKENVVTVAQDSCFMGNFKKLSAYAEQKVSLAQERNKELYENCNLLRKQVFKCEIDKVELECKIRELQLELADALKKLSMAEASLDLTMRCSRNLEEAKLGLQKELGEGKSKIIVQRHCSEIIIQRQSLSSSAAVQSCP
ncbi:uncharacterized protein [Heliangelus exortis]|uniref:uncharacterized protein n=1 Tax=Heliangelus exortis TaxID=472823 RepID=UPI003A8DB966